MDKINLLENENLSLENWSTDESGELTSSTIEIEKKEIEYQTVFDASVTNPYITIKKNNILLWSKSIFLLD